MNKILTALSYIFHPLFISVYAVLLFFSFGKHYFLYVEIYYILIQIVILTIFIPIAFYFLLLSIGKVDSVMMAQKKQRIIPLLVHCLLLFFIIKNTIKVEIFHELHFFFVSSLVSTIFALIALFADIKASLHMIGISALATFIIGLNIHFQLDQIMLICALVICVGAVATSRLHMKAHTNNELILGSIIGCVPQIIMMYFWL